MADRRSHLLMQCHAATRARQAQAEAAHGVAVRAEADADRARTAAMQALSAAERTWSRQLAERFDPTLNGLLAAQVLDMAERCDARARDHDRICKERDASVEAWHRAEGRCRAVEGRLAIARRRAARRADEARLAVQADRVCFAWRISR